MKRKNPRSFNDMAFIWSLTNAAVEVEYKNLIKSWSGTGKCPSDS